MKGNNEIAREYHIFRTNESYNVQGSNREDAIYNLHVSTGMPEDFINKNFFIRRIY